MIFSLVRLAFLTEVRSFPSCLRSVLLPVVGPVISEGMHFCGSVITHYDTFNPPGQSARGVCKVPWPWALRGGCGFCGILCRLPRGPVSPGSSVMPVSRLQTFPGQGSGSAPQPIRSCPLGGVGRSPMTICRCLKNIVIIVIHRHRPFSDSFAPYCHNPYAITVSGTFTLSHDDG